MGMEGRKGLSSERPFLPLSKSRLHPQNDGKRLEQDGHGLAGLKLEHTGALGGDDGADGGAFVEGDEDFGFDFSELDALHLAGEVVACAGGRVAGADDDPRGLDRRSGVDAFAEFEVVGAFSRDDGDDLKAGGGQDFHFNEQVAALDAVNGSSERVAGAGFFHSFPPNMGMDDFSGVFTGKVKVTCRQGRALLPEELLDDLERHVAAQKLYAPRMPDDPGAEELFRQIDVFRPLIEDAAHIALIEVQHFAAQAEHEGGLQHLPDFRHDGFGKLKFPEVLPPDADDGTGKV